MSRTLLAVGVLLSICAQVCAADRNIVVFVVDDQGLDAGCYGNKVIQPPNLDRLAMEGTRFDYAFCTTASCSVSRSVILSGLHNHFNGQYGHQHGYNNFHSKKLLRTLPILLSEAGYRTARIGKYHVQPEEVYHFDTHIQGNSGGSRNPVTMADACRGFVGEKSDKPFFLYFCTSDPHRSGGVRKNKPSHLKRKATHYGKREVAKYLQRPRDELYDLLADPHEIVNLADDSKHAESLKRLQRDLQAWQKATKDPWVVKYLHE